MGTYSNVFFSFREGFLAKTLEGWMVGHDEFVSWIFWVIFFRPFSRGKLALPYGSNLHLRMVMEPKYFAEGIGHPNHDLI